MGRRRVAAAGMLVIATFGSVACGGTRFSGSDAGGPTTTVVYGRGLARASTTVVDPADPAADTAAPTGSGPTAPAPGSGSSSTAPPPSGIDVAVVDPNGTPRPGVLVRAEGPRSATATSDGKGRARLSVPPGTYAVTAPEGCSGQVRVLRSGRASVGVPEATVTPGQLVVEVEPRYRPASPVRYEGNAGWRIGEVHDVFIRLVDPCGGAIPSVAAYGAVRFVPGEGVELVTPLSDAVDDDDNVTVSLRCTGEADVELAMVDALDERRRTPILTTELMPEQQPPFCF